MSTDELYDEVNKALAADILAGEKKTASIDEMQAPPQMGGGGGSGQPGQPMPPQGGGMPQPPQGGGMPQPPQAGQQAPQAPTPQGYQPGQPVLIDQRDNQGCF